MTTSFFSPVPLLGSEREELIEAYRNVRRSTEKLCEPLEPEDMVVQTDPEVSPTKWHLAHTSWFFETFILREAIPGYQNPVKEYPYIFNSYYQAAGPMHCRARRGHLSRPTVSQIFDYRRRIDESLNKFLKEASAATFEKWKPLILTGIHHEHQHQELILTDIKHVFNESPLKPVYLARKSDEDNPPATRAGWRSYEEGLYEIGHLGEGFHYDNECPRHRIFLRAFALADRPVSVGDYLDFIQDGGYRRPEFWHSLGWAKLQEAGWEAPLYWENTDGRWTVFTLSGCRHLNLHEPVCHVSFFEAAAYARWARARLPEEGEWEIAAQEQPISGNFLESRRHHPAPPSKSSDPEQPLHQLYGDVWEWTRSSYSPYPGYEAAFGALGEYNGKFMCNQYVLRGGSCATARSHLRTTYRNFFPPDKRWQFSGFRLARDLS